MEFEHSFDKICDLNGDCFHFGDGVSSDSESRLSWKTFKFFKNLNYLADPYFHFSFQESSLSFRVSRLENER